PDARFNKTTDQQDRLTEDVPAIAIAGLGRFRGKIKRTLSSRGSEEIKSPGIVRIEGPRSRAVLQKLGLSADLIQELMPVLQASEGYVRPGTQSAGRIREQIVIAVDAIRVIADTEDADV